MTDAGPLTSHDPPAAYGRHAAPPAPASGPGLIPAPQPAQVTEYPLTFTGTAGEYFRIWIVNVALTLVTLGIYLPWARVRTRQYFYGHTWLDGHNFEYLANPRALLRGYLLVGALFVGFSVASQFEATVWIAGALALLYIALYPWLVRQSMRFQAANTVHRGLNFRFHGPVAGAYVAYGAANVVGAISSSLALPWAWFMQRRYQLDHLAYGQARARFRGEVGPFYLIGLSAVGLSLGLGVLVVLGLVGLVVLLEGREVAGLGALGADGTALALVGGYLSVLLLYTLVWQYVRAAIMAYVLNMAELGGVVRARATFRPWPLVWIGLTNSAATVLTLGLASPWAAIRRTRYVLERLQIRAIASLDDFAAGAVQGESAVGEAATDLLDIQVGF